SNERGEVACRVYRRLPARRLWDLIMTSTYDYAEPGFVLMDRVPAMNNNKFCEEIFGFKLKTRCVENIS
ncbi:MAG: hypothetical protein H7839_23725, partial [Magnetococcus sp. YQC-5]